MYQVKDAMSRNPLSISPEASVSEAIELLLDHDVSGVPVLVGNKRLVGIITQFQLLEVLYDPDLRHKQVRDFMTKDLLTIEEHELLARAASLMVLHRIRRLPVLCDGQLTGIVSRGDLLRYFRSSGKSIHHVFDEIRNLADAPEVVLTQSL